MNYENNSTKIIKHRDYKWKWSIQNFNVKDTFTRKFSFDVGKLVMKLEMIPCEPFTRSLPFWYFEEIHSTLQNKEFHLLITCDNEDVYYETTYFDRMIFKRKYFVDDWNNIQQSNVFSCLDNKMALNLKFEMTIRDILYDDQPDTQLKCFIFDEKIFSNGTKNLLCGALQCDFEFCVEDDTIPAHKALLAARSEVFEEIFNSNDEEKIRDVANVKDVSKRAFKKFLLYLYTEELSSIGDFLFDLLELSHKFEVTDLKNKCEEQLSNQLNDATANVIFQKVHRFDLSDDLKLSSFKLIKKKFVKYNQELNDDFIEDPDRVMMLLNAIQVLEDGFKKRVKIADNVTPNA